jgi:hypothetical protein
VFWPSFHTHTHLTTHTHTHTHTHTQLSSHFPVRGIIDLHVLISGNTQHQSIKMPTTFVASSSARFARHAARIGLITLAAVTVTGTTSSDRKEYFLSHAASKPLPPKPSALKIEQQTLADKQTSAMVLQVARRLKSGLDENKLTYLYTTKSGIKVSYPSDNLGKFTPDGYPIARVGVVEIDAHVDKVAQLWADQGNRREWDNTLADCQSIVLPDTNQVLTYLSRKSISWFAPGRNFVIQVVKSPGALLVCMLSSYL